MRRSQGNGTDIKRNTTEVCRILCSFVLKLQRLDKRQVEVKAVMLNKKFSNDCREVYIFHICVFGLHEILGFYV